MTRQGLVVVARKCHQDLNQAHEDVVDRYEQRHCR